MTPSKAEKEFEEIWKEGSEKRLWDLLEQPITTKEICKGFYMKAHSQQQEKIDRLKEGIKHLPFSVHSEAFSAGLDADGAWECFVEECQEYFLRLLKEVEG